MQHNREVRLPGNPRSNRRCGFSGTRSVKLATGRGNVGNQAYPGNHATGRKQFQLRNTTRIGTWNVRGLLDEGKLHILDNELQRCDITITGLSETHWKSSGHRDLDKHTIYYSGDDSSSFAGVAIAIPKQWTKAVLGYNPVSNRIITMKIDSCPTPLNIIQVYAPTSTAKDEDVERFYNDIESSIATIPSRELLIILGDFNAKVGDTRLDMGLRNIVGNYGFGQRNDRGERLLQFAADNNLTIMNTVFQQHRRRLYTWTSPDGNHRNQIDYILIRSRWRSSIKNAHTLPGADCQSDHQLLVCTLKLKLRNSIPRKTNKRLEIVDHTAFRNQLAADNSNWRSLALDDDPDSLWQSAKEHIKNTIRSSQPTRTKGIHQHWMSDDTWRLVEHRRELKAKGASVQELNLVGTQIQSSTRKDRNNHLKNICQELEKNAERHEAKDLFKKIRTITRQFKPKTWAIEDVNGVTVTEIRDIVGVWRDYCAQLFSDSSTTPSCTSTLSQNAMEPLILKSEVRAAIEHLKRNKAVGVDTIPIEVFKAMGEYGADIMHVICNRIWETEKWPRDWAHSVFIPLHKKGSTKKCGNYRLISLITHASKVLLHIINTRLRAFLNPEIAIEQAGFVKGRGTREQILILRQIIEKSREFNIPLYICFVDFRKAFDTVRWHKLWDVLIQMGVPIHLVRLIRRLYEDGTATVRIDDVDSKSFHTHAGVRQGCILSPLLFNIYTECIMRIVMDQWDKGISVGGRKISNLRYADDTTLLTQTKEDMENLLTRLETTSLSFGLTINRDKTKMMIVDRAELNHPDISMVGNCEVVQSYVYLGSTITNTGGCEDEIRRRCAITRSAVDKLKRVWCNRNITKATKVRLMRSLVFPIFLYGAETWTVRLKDRRKIDALEMWCWRRLLRIPWTAFRTNVSILEELKVKQRLSSTVQIRIIKYFGHVVRNEHSMERLVVQGQVEGKRSRGRSPTRWTDLIKASTQTSIVQNFRDAEDRNKWRSIARAALAKENAESSTTTTLSRVND